MDFKFRAVYNSSQPPPYPPSSVFHERLLEGAGGFPMMSAEEVEKKRICEEMARARARRRKLEEELRRELVFEREMGIPVHMSLEPPPRPQTPIMDHAEIKQNTNQNQLQERVNLRLNPKSNLAIEDTAQPRIIDPAEIKPTNNQVEVIPLERVNLRWNPKSSLDAIEDIPQPRIMNPSEIKPTNNSDQVIPLERVNQQLNPKLNQVAIEDMPQPGIMDPAEIKPASLQDERIMRERVHLRLDPKSNLVPIEDMPQPRFMDPAEINQYEVIPPERVHLRLDPKSNLVPIEDMPQPRFMDPAEINQDEVIPPAKPDTDLYDAKRKAEAPAVNDSQICLIQKPKKEWACMLCRVTASDENSLNVHLNGKKHKAKEAALEAEKIIKSSFSLLSPTKNVKSTETINTTTSGLNAKADIKTHQALGGEDSTQQNNLDEVIVQAKPDTDLYDAKQKAEAPAVNDSQIFLIQKPKKEWGCMLCGVTASDENSLNVHLNGKKHKAKEAALEAEKIVKSTFSLLSPTKNVKSTETINTTTSGLNAKADIKTHQALGGKDMTQQNNLDEVIVLAKPDTDLYDAKRKAEAPAVNDSQICLIKKPKKEWGCMLCGVTAFDENSLNVHLNGKKHKAKEAALEAEKIVKSTFSLLSPPKNLKSTDTIITTTSGLNAKEDIKTHKASGEDDMTQQNNLDEVIVQVKPDTDLYDAKRKAEAPAVNDSQIYLIKKPKKEWGCMLCGVTAFDENSLNVHLNGKKHKAKEAALEAEKIVKSTFSLLSPTKNLKSTDTIITTTSGLNAKEDIKTHQALGGEDMTQQNNLNEVIVQAKPDTDLYDAKRKAEAPAVNDSQFGLIKKPKEWGCMLCGVTAPDENSLNLHLNGKKHKTKEAALEAEKIVMSTFSLLSLTKNLKSTDTIITTTSGLNAKEDIKTHQALGGEDMTQQNVDSSAAEANKEEQVVQKSQNIGVSEINEVTTEEADKTNAFVGREMKFWGCKLCGVTATDASSLNAHLFGRKHKAREAALGAEKTVRSTTSSLSAMKNVKSTETIINTTSGLDAKAWGGEDESQKNVDSSAVDANKEEQVVQKSQNIGVSEINEVTTEEAGKTNALVGRKRELWCDICGISATSQLQMEDHKKGSKHRRRMELTSYADKFL
ncbi:uncharacterized protein LOC130714371 isoform X2 [Lotus japonicus]|uniref:uncharacterized protein LOC130714371 isoform X2 n=1 Tax=Lotus japonicus TaxID=34305 RepID=UPI002584D8ED|nr:uncharacterized protein LOC130714371 isoform X2 [Lotus japonicus]